MYLVTCNDPSRAYEVHSLVQAFLPDREVKVLTSESVRLARRTTEETPEMNIEIREDGAVVSIPAEENEEPKVYSWIRNEKPGEPEDFSKALRLFLYEVLSEVFDKKLPWGNLTGIRPAKIAELMLEDGKSEEEIRAFMRGTHHVSDAKIDLSMEIAKLEKDLLSRIDPVNGYSLYVGIPFCPTTCLYCSFTSYPIGRFKSKVADYLAAVKKEIDYTAEAFKDKKLETIYIGGGTPTTLEPEELEELITYIKESFDLQYLQEFTVESGRPDSITSAKLETMKRLGVDRISVNPQTMKGETLKLIGRHHTPEQARESFAMARAAGFENINMDLILGLPEETPEDVAETIRQIRELNPDSLTVHSLAVKKASALRNWIEENGISALKNTDETMEIASAGARAMGMAPYYMYRQKNMSGNFENVGYARPGKEGLYNVLIMEEQQTIVALGAGTVSKRVFPDGRIERCDTVKEVDMYIERIDEMIERKRELFGKE